MRKFAVVALLAAAVSLASAQTKAPSMTVFDLELGKSFTVPECKLFKLGKQSFSYAGTDQVVCYRRFYSDVQSGPAMAVPEGMVSLAFPPANSPTFTSGVSARLIAGNLEAMYLSTLGTLYSQENFVALTGKYGPPTSLQKGIAVTLMGAQIETISASWDFAGLGVSYISVYDRVDCGLIVVETTKGAAATAAARAPQGPKL